MLPDGRYDAIVFDAEDHDDAVVVELTVLAGEHKGEVVSVRAEGVGADALDLLGLPATITVTDGAPTVVFEP